MYRVTKTNLLMFGFNDGAVVDYHAPLHYYKTQEEMKLSSLSLKPPYTVIRRVTWCYYYYNVAYLTITALSYSVYLCSLSSHWGTPSLVVYSTAAS